MELIRIILKIFMWILIIGFGCNFIMQTISYHFYKGAKQIDQISVVPVNLQYAPNLSGYGYHLDSESDNVIIFFGGSNDIAYNSVAKYANAYSCPFVSADYYGTQDSRGKLNLKSMQQTTIDLYDWVSKTYPKRNIIVMGHSYGSGMASYLASVRKCEALILLAAYRDLSDLYNKIIPIFWGPAKLFISNNIQLSDYAKRTSCQTYIISSYDDKTLSNDLQEKVCNCYSNAKLKVFENVKHESYLVNEQVTDYINTIIRSIPKFI